MIKTVVLTRDPAGNRRWATGLHQAGFRVINAPMIDATTISLTPRLTQALCNLADYGWLVLTSARAAASLQHLLEQAGLTTDKLPPVAAVGRATAAAAERAGFAVTFVPRTATAASLGTELAITAGQKILLAQANIAPPDLAKTLSARGAIVTSLPVYTIMPRDRPDLRLTAKLQQPYTAILLASPSAALVLAELHPAAGKLPAVTIGPTTTTAAQAAGYVAVRQAAAPDLPSVISALKLL